MWKIHFSNSLQKLQTRPLEWRSGLRALHRSASCATRYSGLESRLCRSRPWPGDQWGGAELAQRCPGYRRLWPAGKSMSHLTRATSVVGRAQCTLTQSSGVQCFHRHIGAAGIRVKWTLCQQAVRLGWVVFWRTHGSWPSRLPSPYGSCSIETRL